MKNTLQANVLIAANDNIVAEDLRASLIKFGYDIAGVVCSTDDAIKLAQEHTPDLILMDIALPGKLDSVKTAEFSFSNWGTPVVFLVSEEDIDQLEKFIPIAPFYFLLKPINLKDLKVRMAMILKLSRVESDLKDEKQSRRRSEDKFQSIFKSMASWTWEIDPELRFTKCSEGVEYYLGYKPEEMIGKTPLDFMEPDEADRVVEEYLAMSGDDRLKPVKDQENWMRHKDGNMVCLATNSVPIVGEKGDLLGHFGFNRDITEKKLAEEALKHSEERYDLAMQFVNDGLWDMNLETREIYFSPSWKRMLGYKDHEIKNEVSEWERFIDSEDVAPIRKMVEEVIARTRDRFEIEFRMLHKNGRWIDILSRGNVVFDENGKGVRLVGTNVDITERKWAENALRKAHGELEYKVLERTEELQASNERLTQQIKEREQAEEAYRESEAFLNLTGQIAKVGGWEVDGKSIEAFWTKETYNIVEVPFDGIPVPFEEALVFFTLEDKIKFAKLIQRAFEQNETSDLECQITTAKGNKKWIKAVCNPIVVDNKVIKLSGTFQDITEQREAEEEKETLRSQLQQSQKMEAIGTLAGGIAHDFNNILSVILGYTELAQTNLPEGSKASNHLGQSLIGLNRATELVKQILTFSRKSDQELQPIKVQTITKEVMKLLRSSLPTTIDIRKDIDYSCENVLADPTQIHQIILNLCTNSSHALRETGGIIAVSLKQVRLDQEDIYKIIDLKPGSYVKLEVSDNGIGMEKEIQEKIFDPYFTTKKKGEGTGLGLSVVHGIVKTLSGDITVYSEPGKGTTFNVYLPVNASAKEIAPEKISITNITGNEHILIVDDDQDIVQMNKEMLENQGYTIYPFTDSVEALSVFEKAPAKFDLLITDMTMPQKTGAELSQEVLATRPDLPIILRTGFSDLINEEEAKRIGIKKYLMKPVRQNDLLAAVREVLDGDVRSV